MQVLPIFGLLIYPWMKVRNHKVTKGHGKKYKNKKGNGLQVTCLGSFFNNIDCNRPGCRNGVKTTKINEPVQVLVLWGRRQTVCISLPLQKNCKYNGARL